jgi:phosphonate transport system substrate-binding protein
MKRLFFSALLFCAFMTAEAAPEGDALRVGIQPFNTPVGLFRTHQPLRDYLETVLNRPVRLFSSPSYSKFMRDILDGQFDIVIVGPNLGIICLQQGNFVPLVRYRNDFEFVFAVRSDRGIVKFSDPRGKFSALRGKKITFPERMTIFSIAGIKFLEDVGMKRDVDYVYMERPNHAAAIMEVVVGGADAAVTGPTVIRQMPPDIREKLKVLPWNKTLPSLMTLAMTRLGEDQIQRIKSAFERFPETPAGRQFFADTKYGGYTQVTEEDLKAMRPYIPLTLQMMKERAEIP